MKKINVLCIIAIYIIISFKNPVILLHQDTVGVVWSYLFDCDMAMWTNNPSTVIIFWSKCSQTKLVHKKTTKIFFVTMSQPTSNQREKWHKEEKTKTDISCVTTKTVLKTIVCSCETSLIIHRSCLWKMINYKPKEQHMYMYSSVHMWPYTSTAHRPCDLGFGFSVLPGSVHCTGSWNGNVENWLSRTLGVLCYEMSVFGCSVVMRHTSQLLSFSQTDLRNKCELPTVSSLILYLLQSPLLKLTVVIKRCYDVFGPEEKS